MDFLTYSKIRAYCWQDMGPHIDTPDRATLRRMRVKAEGGRRGDIHHEAIEAKWFIEATGYLTPREHAAAVLLANVSNLYLEIADAAKVEAAQLERITAEAITDYANFLPEREAAALVEAYANLQTHKAAPDTLETKEQRQDRRLQACEAAGLDFKNYRGRLPAGVAIVAERERVTRQSFSTDVKAALKRRDAAKREGVTTRHA